MLLTQDDKGTIRACSVIDALVFTIHDPSPLGCAPLVRNAVCLPEDLERVEITREAEGKLPR